MKSTSRLTIPMKARTMNVVSLDSMKLQAFTISLPVSFSRHSILAISCFNSTRWELSTGVKCNASDKGVIIAIVLLCCRCGQSRLQHPRSSLSCRGAKGLSGRSSPSFECRSLPGHQRDCSHNLPRSIDDDSFLLYTNRPPSVIFSLLWRPWPSNS